jgi:hypothetical protein
MKIVMLENALKIDIIVKSQGDIRYDIGIREATFKEVNLFIYFPGHFEKASTSSK